MRAENKTKQYVKYYNKAKGDVNSFIKILLPIVKDVKAATLKRLFYDVRKLTGYVSKKKETKKVMIKNLKIKKEPIKKLETAKIHVKLEDIKKQINVSIVHLQSIIAEQNLKQKKIIEKQQIERKKSKEYAKKLDDVMNNKETKIITERVLNTKKETVNAPVIIEAMIRNQEEDDNLIPLNPVGVSDEYYKEDMIRPSLIKIREYKEMKTYGYPVDDKTLLRFGFNQKEINWLKQQDGKEVKKEVVADE